MNKKKRKGSSPLPLHVDTTHTKGGKGAEGAGSHIEIEFCTAGASVNDGDFH